ncbi:zinc metallopeptidase [Erysipelothrix tonsillarum]|uniref:zinc metallopeptidase n=1 Tax=Erysipelothrix tonsillarum TaxID=38402 RepID=UPI000361F149|nr:zinc metallopeptidase [Erysipelothrix tonsillarum]
MGLMGVGYGFVILAAIISFAAQMYVQSAYSKYSQVDTLEHLTGAQVARRILELKNIDDVQVVQSNGGELSDHYDPNKKIVALSPKVYNETSIASVSVAAHECGHAVQHAENYGFIGLRNTVLPFAIVASKFSMIPIMIGLFGNPQFLKIGIVLLGVIAVFQLVTLPVEFDASMRAIKILDQEQILDAGELQGSKKMLTAAALTYVAALLGTLLSILRYIAIFNRRND